MSESAVQKNFHDFCKHFSENLYKEYVALPQGAEMTKVRKEYHDLGFTGAVGSTDVAHVAWDCCPHSQLNLFTGKKGRPTIAYQATVTHSRYVVGVTQGYPGAQNGKTIIRNDLTVSTVREKKWFKEMEYKLKNVKGEDELCCGAYLIVDGGYHKASDGVQYPVPEGSPVGQHLIYLYRLGTMPSEFNRELSVEIPGPVRCTRHIPRGVNETCFSCCACTLRGICCACRCPLRPT